jgi:hypothetical protein
LSGQLGTAFEAADERVDVSPFVMPEPSVDIQCPSKPANSAMDVTCRDKSSANAFPGASLLLRIRDGRGKPKRERVVSASRTGIPGARQPAQTVEG